MLLMIMKDMKLWNVILKTQSGMGAIKRSAATNMYRELQSPLIFVSLWYGGKVQKGTEGG